MVENVSNGGSRRIAPTMAQRMAAIHSNAARLLPNPTLPNTAKAMRMSQPQAKANQHLDRSQFLRQVGELRQGCKSDCFAVRRLCRWTGSVAAYAAFAAYAKLSLQTGS